MRKKRLIDRMMDDMDFDANGDWINGQSPITRRRGRLNHKGDKESNRAVWLLLLGIAVTYILISIIFP